MFAASKTDSASTGGYQISRSLRFNSADSAYLNRTPASATNRQTWTWSGWVKRTALGAYSTIFGHCSSDGLQQHTAWFRNDDTLQFYIYSSGYNLNLITTQVFRDVSAWYHIVIAQDTTQATDTNRAKIYVNGVQVTAFSTAAYPSQNLNGFINSNVAHGIGSFPPALGSYFDGYQTEINLIDGQQLTPSSFGETNAQTGVWQPKAYSGSYGTNGFYLNFSDNSNTTAATLGKDYSGNGNNWTPNNFSVTAGAGNDSLVDSPTSYGTDTGVGGTVRGNYCTLNPLSLNGATLSNGNLDVDTGTTNGYYALGTMAFPSSGKWYFEYTPTANGNNSFCGVADSSSPLTLNVSYYAGSGEKYVNGVNSAYGISYGNGSVIGVAVNVDSGTVTFYVNNASQGAITYATSSGNYLAFFADGTGGSATTYNTNFGQRPFAYTAPSGFKALCTQNLPTPTIGATTATQAGKYFNPVLYTGNGSTQAITGVGFQPDMTWIKVRSTTYDHQLVDAVRGSGKVIHSNLTNAEATLNTVTSFDSNGFTVNGTTYAGTNGNGSTFVAWNWKANGSGSTNTAGSITSTVSANTTSGFSIVTYTGNGSNSTVGHGLGVAPKFIIIKSRSGTTGWPVYSESVGNTRFGYLNTTDFFDVNSTAWNNTSPTSSVFTIGTGVLLNASGATYVAYCFAEVAGYSKFTSWTGNGSADGPFIFTGFRPAYVLVKITSASGEGWWVFDNKRNAYNVTNSILSPNSSGAEITGDYGIDMVSNGFKIRNSQGFINSSGATYICAAFAESPFKYSLAR